MGEVKRGVEEKAYVGLCGGSEEKWEGKEKSGGVVGKCVEVWG